MRSEIRNVNRIETRGQPSIVDALLILEFTGGFLLFGNNNNCVFLGRITYLLGQLGFHFPLS